MFWCRYLSFIMESNENIKLYTFIYNCKLLYINVHFYMVLYMIVYDCILFSVLS